MDFFFNVKFDTWEEYSAFCAHAEGFFRKQKPASNEKKVEKALSQKKAQPKATPKSTKKVAHEVVDYTPPETFVIHQVQGYKPSKALIQRVNEMIADKQTFRAVDVAQGAVKNSNYKAKVNKWLQSHPELSFNRQKTEGKGKGTIVYTPHENGKVLLPPGEKPKRTDWPIKGASYRPAHHPKFEPDDEDALEAELIADFEPPNTQVAS